MISILLTWIVLLIVTLAYGKAIVKAFYGNRYQILCATDIYLICGILAVNLYAQIWSLFRAIDGVAFGGVCVGACLCLWYLGRGERHSLCGIRGNDLTKKNVFWMLFAVATVLLWTDLVPQHYDTYLYHAQAIHWIEEYGVVPGLGNLHFRLAYNSAFMTLQSLFSFKWLTGQSLHTVNGFMTLFMLIYCIKGIRHIQGRASDVLKLACVGYMLYDCIQISSPNTDTMVLLLIFYIVIKWSEFEENDVRCEGAYGFLCILTVYAATLKLSSAVLVLLTLYPAYYMLHNRNVKLIVKHLLMGLIIGIPFLVRNVILSGYLIYPYWELDLFSVDWKMSCDMLKQDRKEIIAWGRGNMDVTRVDESILQWFGEWYLSIHLLWKILFVCAVAAIIVILVYTVYAIRCKKEHGVALIRDIVCVCGMFFWLCTAPLPRYGAVYMLILCGIAVSYGIQRADIRCRRHCCSTVSLAMRCCVILYGCLYLPYTIFTGKAGMETLVMQNDYENRQTTTAFLGGIAFAIPTEGNQTGYEPFPSAPGIRQSIVCRGDELGDGFKRIDEE